MARHWVWRGANACLLGGLITWPLESKWLRIHHQPMRIPGLGREFDGVRLAHLSDLHCGTLVREKHLLRYVETVNALDVDFIAITGDFITTGSKRYARTVARVLSHLRPRKATLACLGNHDYGLWHPLGWGKVQGIDEFLAEELAASGIIVLRNSTRSFFAGEDVLQFVGAEDFWSPLYDVEAAFELANPDTPTIALVHNPDAATQMASMGASWVLSGHTHGKVTPDTFFWDVVYPTRFKNFVGGQYDLAPGRHLYVNRGIGNTLRVSGDHKPEITLFTLKATPAWNRAHRLSEAHVALP